MPTFHAVITRYKEDVEWVRQLTIPCTIYNKGDTPTGLEADFSVRARENVGREGETYLHHIIEHYDELPDYLVLLQGNPFDHCYNLFTILEDIGQPEVLVPLANNWKREVLDGEYTWDGFKECLIEFATKLGLPRTVTLGYAAGAQYVVPRAVVHVRPKKFYEELIARLNYKIDPLEGWAFERLWPYIFGANAQSGSAAPQVVAVQPGQEKDALTAALAPERNVLLFTKGTVPPVSVPTALEAAYIKAKFMRVTEDDPVLLVAGSSFFTCRAVLLQHRSYLERSGLDPVGLQERGVRVLTVSG